MKRKSLLFLLLMAMFAPWAAQAQETLTVYDGTNTNSYIPFYSLYADYGTRSQFIIPAAQLESLDGTNITKLAFYAGTASKTYDQEFTVYLKEVNYTVFESATLEDWDGMTAVYVGTIATDANKVMEIDFSDTPYTYEGGNLMIGFQVTNWGTVCPSMSWYGVSQTSGTYTAAYNNANSSHVWGTTINRQAFLPKTTFTYEPAATGGCEKPEDLMANGEPTDTEFSFNIVGGSGLYNIFTKAGDGDWTNWEYEWEDTEVNLTGLTGNTAYQVRVQSVCTDMTDPETGDAATSGWKTLSFTTKNPCAAPTNLQVSDITTESATLTWTAGYQETTWTVKYKKSTETTYTEETVTGTSTITLSGLTGGTIYNVQVYNCENYVSGTFNTECATITTFPWSEDFDSYATGAFSHPCWVNEHISGNGSSVFQISSSNNQTGSTRTLQLPDMSNGTKTKLRLPEMTLATSDSYLFSIDVNRNTSGNSYTSEGVRVFASTDGEIEGATELGFLYRNCNQTDGGVVTAETATGWYTYEFPIPFTGTCYIILRGESQYGSSTYMDNFKVKKELPCVKPANPTFVSSTTTSATLSWTNGAEGQTAWQIAYSTDASFNPDEVTPVDVTSNPATIDGLTPSTIYYAYVRANCGDLGYSEWSTAYCQFATACGAITTFPWTETFESYASGNFSDPCWVNEHIEGSGAQLFKVYTSTNAGNTTHQLQLPDMAIGTLTKLVLPEMNLPENYEFSIDIYRSSSTYNDNYPYEGIRVYASTDGEIEGATELAFIPRQYAVSNDVIPAEAAQGWYTYELPIGMSGTCYIILRGESQYCAATYMDNLTVMAMPTCVKPTNLAQTHTNHSATLSWTAGNEGQNAWQIAYSTTSFDPNAADFDLTTVEVIDVEDNPYTFDKTLAANTHYYMYVRGNCGDEDYSKWVGIDFTTGTANPSPTVTTVDEITPVSAVLRWTAAGGDYLESYDIYYSQTSGQPANDSLIQYTGVDAGFTSKILENLTEGYWYVYMRAYHGETDGYSSWTPYYGYGFQVPEACPKPTNLTAGNPTPNSITLTWTEGATWQYAWDVAYSTDSLFDPADTTATYSIVEVFGQQGPTITCTVTGLDSNTTYYFSVMGHCNSPYGDCDEWTNVVSETTLDGCPVPFDINVTTASNTATINWTGFSDSYTVQYRTAGGYETEIFQGFENGLGDWIANISSSSSGIKSASAHEGSFGFTFVYSEQNASLISPVLDGSNGVNVSFYYREYTSSYGDEQFYVGYTTNENETDPTAFEYGDIITASLNWQEYTETFPEGTKRIAIQYVYNDAMYLYIDDITIQCGEYNEPSQWVEANTNTESVTLLNLIYGRKYEAQVKAECSDYSDMFTFTTKALKRFTTAGDWSVADNWTPAGAPTMDNDVTVEAAATITGVANADIITIDGGSITIEDGGQLVHNNAGVTATVKKHIAPWNVEASAGDNKSDGWYFISNPFTTSITPSVDNGLLTEGYDLYDWYATSDLEWHNYHDDDFTLSYYNHPGYLYANANEVTLTFTGTVYNSMNRISVSTYYNSGAEFGQWNLIGNPFVCNAYLVDNAGNALPYYKMNADGNGYDAVTGAAIAPVTGIFYEAPVGGRTVYFTREAPASSKGELAMNLRSNNKQLDNAIVRFGEGQQMSKFSFRENSSKIYMPIEGQDYAIVNAGQTGEMPVSFKAEKNGTYSLNFTSQEVSFSYLHLIDNMTGADVDLLQTPSYTFNATTSDYASRFRLVFATGSSVSNDSFSFINASGNLCIFGIEGKATVQVIDVMGHVLSSDTFSGSYEKSINAAPGVYMIRLINGNDVKVQKIVVR